jgi:hypothetical protein
MLALLALAALVAAGIGVAGVRSRDDGSASSAASSAAQVGKERAEPGTATAGGFAADAAGGASTGSAAPPLPSSEHIVRRGELRLRVPRDVPGAVDRVGVIASGLGGFVADSATSSSGRAATADLTIRVPAARFDEARRRLRALGKVEGTELSGEDVGGQLVDLDARLRSLRSEEVALDGLLGEARDIPQILQVRDRLTSVRTQIEQLAGQQASLQDQAAMSTIHVSLRRAGSPAKPRPADDHLGLRESLRTAAHATVAVAGGIAITAGALLPIALLALVAWVVVRRRQGGATTREV